MRKTLSLTFSIVIVLAFFAPSVSGMNDQSNDVKGVAIVDDTELAMQGIKLTAEEAALLEKEVEKNPDDIGSRTKLLGYYMMKKHTDTSARDSQQSHVLWLIKNKPRATILRLPFAQLNSTLDSDVYQNAKELWLKHLEDHPSDLKILEHTAAFFLLQSSKLAEQSLLKGRELAPDDPKWPSKLGQLYSLSMQSQSKHEKAEMAVKSLEQFQAAYELSTDLGRDSMLSSIASVAFEANNTDVAREYATKMINQRSNDWNTGNNVFHGNAILGRLALQEQDIEKAKQHLLAAGKTSGSPQLGSFGPNMRLAKELLEAGEKEVVLEYFDLCSEFWESGKDRLDQWSSEVKKGVVPEFKANLGY